MAAYYDRTAIEPLTRISLFLNVPLPKHQVLSPEIGLIDDFCHDCTVLYAFLHLAFPPFTLFMIKWAPAMTWLMSPLYVLVSFYFSSSPTFSAQHHDTWRFSIMDFSSNLAAHTNQHGEFSHSYNLPSTISSPSSCNTTTFFCHVLGLTFRNHTFGVQRRTCNAYIVYHLAIRVLRKGREGECECECESWNIKRRFTLHGMDGRSQ